jgi:hypothetical protein
MAAFLRAEAYVCYASKHLVTSLALDHSPAKRDGIMIINGLPALAIHPNRRMFRERKNRRRLMDRRKTLLGSAGAALLSQLEACGGGDADTASSNSNITAGSPSESGTALSEKAVTTDYSPNFLGGNYHIEVCYAKDLPDGVIEMYHPNSISSLTPNGVKSELGRANYVTPTSGPSVHIIRPIGLGEVNSSSYWKCKLVFTSSRLGLTISTESTTPAADGNSAASWSSTVPDLSAPIFYHVHFFASLQNGRKHLASVRFHQKAAMQVPAVNRFTMFVHTTTPEFAVFDSDLTYAPMYKGSRSVERTGSEQRTLATARLFETAITPAYSRTVVKDGVEILCLPKFDHNGQPSGFSAIEPIMNYTRGDRVLHEVATNAAENHLLDFKKKAAVAEFSLSANNVTSPVDTASAFGEELMRVIGGNRFIKSFETKRDEVMDRIGTMDDLDASQLLGSLAQAGIDMSEDDDVYIDAALARQLATQQTNRAAQGKTNRGGMFTLQFALQVVLKLPSKWTAALFGPELLPESLLMQGGARYSLLIDHRRRYWPLNGEGPSDAVAYRIKNFGTDGWRMTVTLTFGTVQIGKFGVDLELSVNLRIKNGKGRIDSMVFDPVFDAPTFGLVRKVLRACGYDSELIGAETNWLGNSLQRINVPPLVDWFFPQGFPPPPPVAWWVDAKPGGGWEIVEITQKEYQDMILRGATSIDRKLNRYWALQQYFVAEFSPFRFVFLNGEVSNPDTQDVFRAGFKGNLRVGWDPGAKILVFAGPKYNFMANDPVHLGGGLTLRCAGMVEWSFVVGGHEYERAHGAQW